MREADRFTDHRFGRAAAIVRESGEQNGSSRRSPRGVGARRTRELAHIGMGGRGLLAPGNLLILMLLPICVGPLVLWLLLP
jgi:hypothetical protein